MTNTDSAALRTSLAYFAAWTSHDFDLAMSHVADTVTCHAPAGVLSGAVAFRGFMEPFSRIVTGSELLAAFGDATTALLMYGTHTVPVPDAPGAELHTVVEGLITEVRIVFDRTPFDAARRAAS